MIKELLDRWNTPPAGAGTDPLTRLQDTLRALGEAATNEAKALAHVRELEQAPLDPGDEDEAVRSRVVALEEAKAELAERAARRAELQQLAESLDVAVFQQRRGQHERERARVTLQLDEAESLYNNREAHLERLRGEVEACEQALREARERADALIRTKIDLEPHARRPIHVLRGRDPLTPPRSRLIRLLEWRRAVEALERSNASALQITVDEHTGRVVDVLPRLPGLVAGSDEPGSAA